MRMTFWKSIVTRWSAHRRALRYLISLEEGYLRAELIDQESLGQAKAFLRAVFRVSLENVRSRVLICARSPKPLPLAGCIAALPDVKRNAWYRSNKIAIVGNSARLGFPGDDIEARARQQGLNLSHFPDEGAALGVVVVVAALLEAALITVAPSAPPAIDPTTSAATAPRRIILM